MRVVVVALAALAVAGPAAAACPSATGLEAQLMCPACNTTLDQSDAPVARRMKAYIERRAAECASNEQIKAELVADFGVAVLAAPPKEGFHLVAWLLPLLGLVAGAAAISLLVWRWSRSRPAAEPAGETNGRVALDPELDRRVDQELARFDA